MFKTAAKVLQMGSGLALFPGLECALAFSQLEPIPVISVLYLTWAGFSCKSCRSETCDYAFDALHSFSIYCSLIKPSDIPWFKSWFFSSSDCLQFGTRQAIENFCWSNRFLLIITLFFETGCVQLIQIALFVLILWRRCGDNNKETGKGYTQSPVFCMFVVAS